tara:strand:- start:116 stop:511 length:396 start_codon:yes stop_codon:yes gene_type:complete
MNPRSISDLDLHIAARLRLRRTMLKMSQIELADSVGVTFQQIQKYERGSNRIGAGRLYELAGTLKVPVTYFYDGLANGAPDHDTTSDRQIMDFLNSAQGLLFVREFLAVKDPRQQTAMRALLRALESKPSV